MWDSFVVIYEHCRSKWRPVQGQDPRYRAMERHQGEMLSTLTDLFSKYRAGGETEPRKSYIVSGVIRNVPCQGSSQLRCVSVIVLAPHVQSKDAAKYPSYLLLDLFLYLESLSFVKVSAFMYYKTMCYEG